MQRVWGRGEAYIGLVGKPEGRRPLGRPRHRWEDNTGVLISPQPDQEGNKLQRQKILIFMYRIYNHNWRTISTIYVYITRLASNEIFSPSNKIHREVGRAKDLSAPLIKMDLQEVGCGDMDWIELAEDRDNQWSTVNAVMNLRVP